MKPFIALCLLLLVGCGTENRPTVDWQQSQEVNLAQGQKLHFVDCKWSDDKKAWNDLAYHTTQMSDDDTARTIVFGRITFKEHK